MTLLGFKRLSSDAGIFLYQKKDGSFVIVIVYVDDALFCGPDKSLVTELKTKFMEKWECHDLGDVKAHTQKGQHNTHRSVHLSRESAAALWDAECQVCPNSAPGWLPTHAQHGSG